MSVYFLSCMVVKTHYIRGAQRDNRAFLVEVSAKNQQLWEDSVSRLQKMMMTIRSLAKTVMAKQL